MAKEYKIEINKRDAIGKKGVKKLRQEGSIPGVFYSKENAVNILICLLSHTNPDNICSWVQLPSSF